MENTQQVLNHLTSWWALLLIAYLGMFVHFANKNIKGETSTAIGNYFRDNLKSTIVAVISTTIGTFAIIFTLGTGQTIDIVSVFGAGYTFDSLFNKWDKSQ